jgi:hypothetical protein
MDTRWWTWNLSFAVLPAVLIGLYCEFYGKYIVYDFHRLKELETMKRLLLHNNNDIENDDDAMLLLQDEELLQALLPTRPEHVGQRILRFWKVLQARMVGTSENVVEEEDNGTVVAVASDTDQPPTTRNQTVVTSRLAARVDDDVGGHHDESTTPVTAPATLASDPASVVVTTQALLERIQRLEARLGDAQSSSTAAHSDNNTRQWQHQVERLQQSDIHNRVEDEKIHMWRQKIAALQRARERQQQKTHPSSQTPLALPEKEPSTSSRETHAAMAVTGVMDVASNAKESLWALVGDSSSSIREPVEQAAAQRDPNADNTNATRNVSVSSPRQVPLAAATESSTIVMEQEEQTAQDADETRDVKSDTIRRRWIWW